ncbi:MAG: hypothetical protein HWE10_15025 [Gammaproteobacteria bacterium]|nr:hypothetical protein [Gammaproteobacteria bacterium]
MNVVVNFRLNFILLVFLILCFKSYAATCPTPPVTQTGVSINETNNAENWIEFYIPAGVTVDFDGWTLDQNSSGNNSANGPFSICSGSSCQFSGGSSGIFVIYGNVPSGVTYGLTNTGYALHNTIQEILMTDGDGKLVHYLNYKNNINNTGSFEYLSCIDDYPDLVTEIDFNGNQKGHCTEVDGLKQEGNNDYDNWTSCEGSTPGTSNDLGPTDILLSNDTIIEYQAYANANIGELSAVDIEINDAHTFEIFWEDANTDGGSCALDFQDNSFFQIPSGSNDLQIVSGQYLTLEPRDYSICVKATDLDNNTYRKNFTITVTPEPENSNFFDLTNNIILNTLAIADASIGSFYPADLGTGLSLNYVIFNEDDNTHAGLCPGDISDNQYFYIDNGELKVQSWVSSSLGARDYNICVKATDENGISYRELFTISVTELATSCTFIVTAPDFIAASGQQEITVQAVESDDNTQACTSSYSGTETVTIDFSYVTPDLNNVSVNESLLYSATSDGATTPITSGDGLSVSLDFSASDATASFYIGYEDVGKLSLSVSDANTVGTVEFIVYPLRLAISLTDSDGQALGGLGNFTHIAGQPFDFNLYAINAKEAITQNYRGGEPQLASIMAVPTIAAGANAVELNYDGTNTVTSADSISWQGVSLSFDETGYTFSGASYNNVGVFELFARDFNYFGYTIAMNKPVSTGRFIPAYFSISDLTANSTDDLSTTPVELSLQNTSGSFSYVGQDIDFSSTPTFQFQARTYTNQLATNYVFDMNTFAFDEQGYVNNSTTSDIGDSVLVLPTQVMMVTDATAFDGFVEFVLNNTFSYTKGVDPSAPISMQLDLDFAASDLQDGDGVGYDSNGINSDDAVFEGYQIDISGVEVRYGRVAIDNAFGPNDVNLRLNVTTEYYDGTRFIQNTDDSTTDFSSFLADIYNEDDTTNTDFTLRVDSSDGNSFTNGSILVTDGLFVDALGQDISLRLQLNNVPNHLLFDWSEDGSLEQPSATILFGRFKGNDRIIYKRER